MAGPTCHIVLSADASEEALDAIDVYLDRVVADLERTRKGRTWRGSINGRPFHVWVDDARDDEPPSVGFAAGCKSPEDYEMLRSVSRAIAQLVGGVATEPIK